MARRQSTRYNFTLPALETAAKADLRLLFVERFGTDPGARASRMFMYGNLSWVQQAARQEKNPERLRQQLKSELDKALSKRSANRPRYRPGTRLVREWHGEVYEVTVLDAGYAWQGRVCRSLSEIASEITGTHWSGPRFFGLNRGGE